MFHTSFSHQFNSFNIQSHCFVSTPCLPKKETLTWITSPNRVKLTPRNLSMVVSSCSFPCKPPGKHNFDDFGQRQAQGSRLLKTQTIAKQLPTCRANDISVAFAAPCFRCAQDLCMPGVQDSYMIPTPVVGIHDPYLSHHSFHVEWSRGCSNMLANTAWTIWNTNKKTFKVAIHCITRIRPYFGDLLGGFRCFPLRPRSQTHPTRKDFSMPSSASLRIKTKPFCK